MRRSARRVGASREVTDAVLATMAAHQRKEVEKEKGAAALALATCQTEYEKKIEEEQTENSQ